MRRYVPEVRFRSSTPAKNAVALARSTKFIVPGDGRSSSPELKESISWQRSLEAIVLSARLAFLNHDRGIGLVTVVTRSERLYFKSIMTTFSKRVEPLTGRIFDYRPLSARNAHRSEVRQL